MRKFRAAAALLLAIALALPAWAGGEIIEEEGLPAATLINAEIPCKSAILIEQTTGRVLFEKDADVPMPPASITKIMTMLLVMEALDAGKISLDDMVTCSEHASSMGGTQIWLEVGEQMTVRELLLACAVSSANDASVALGEYIAGTEEAFVELMNRRAAELGMQNTVFYNATGLDAPGHVASARDIALMSAELLKHPAVTEFTTVWMDSLRAGETQLVNTNKLVRFYDGTTGLKTGTTDDAKYCLAASARRKGLSLIAVVLGAQTSDYRFGAARGLLDYGFANFEAQPVPEPQPPLAPLRVAGGVLQRVGVKGLAPEIMLVEKGAGKNVTQRQKLAESITAPVRAGTPVGTVQVLIDGVLVCEYELVVAEDVDSMTFKSALGMFYNELTRMGAS